LRRKYCRAAEERGKGVSRTFGKIRQIGYVVHDLESSLARFERLGIGPFYRLDHARLDYFRVNGKDMEIDLSIALGYSGGVQVELIQQHNPESSPYKDFLDNRGEGLHHLCMWAEDFEADVTRWQEEGHRIVIDGMIGGGRFVYFDTEMSPGTFLEVGDLSLWRGVMQRMEDEAARWDGRDPVRSLADLVAEVAP
jgi:Glyoxalase/Bleomycin resistance protein/Dioxygenase superfamily